MEGDHEAQEESIDAFYEKWSDVRDESIDYDPQSINPEHLFDQVSSGAHQCNHNFDSLKSGMDKDKFPHLSHTCNHRLEEETEDNYPNQHLLFDKNHYKTCLQATDSKTHTNLFEEVKDTYQLRVAAMGEPNITTVDEYLNYYHGKPCVFGSSICEQHPVKQQHTVSADNEPSNPNYVDFSPHVIRPGENLLCYATTDHGRGPMRQRYKADRNWIYGPGRRCGKRARFCLIKGKFSILMDRVGLQRNNTEDLACTLLPLPIDTIYEVTWESVGVHDAKFELVYTGGAFV